MAATQKTRSLNWLEERPPLQGCSVECLSNPPVSPYGLEFSLFKSLEFFIQINFGDFVF